MIVATLHDARPCRLHYLYFLPFARPLPLSLPAERVSTESATPPLSAHTNSALSTVSSKYAVISMVTVLARARFHLATTCSNFLSPLFSSFPGPGPGKRAQNARAARCAAGYAQRTVPSKCMVISSVMVKEGEL